MLFLVVILCFGLVLAGSDDLCSFKLDSGEHIDLSKLGEMQVSLTECGQWGHTLVFDLCREIPDSDCPSTSTIGPGNACDIFESGGSYYWYGGFTDWTKSDYNETGKSFLLKYKGKVQTQSQPSWTRSWTAEMVCDSKYEYKVECVYVQQFAQETDVEVRVTSKYACPTGLSGGEVAGIVFGTLFGTVFFICCVIPLTVVFLAFLTVGCVILVILCFGAICLCISGTFGSGVLVGRMRNAKYKLVEDDDGGEKKEMQKLLEQTTETDEKTEKTLLIEE